MTREASADTRSRKSGHGADDLTTVWQTEAGVADWSIERLVDGIEHAARGAIPAEGDHRRRCRLRTVCGSKLLSRSRDTSMSTGPISVSTVFERVPLRVLPWLRPSMAYFS